MKDFAVDRVKDLFDDIRRDKKTLVKILFIVLILLIAAVLRISEAGKPSEGIETDEATGVETESTADAELTSSEIYVDIGGQVSKPGVYQVSEGTRVYQLIELAGGLTENADTDSINQASFVEDGEKIIIPKKVSDASLSDEAVSSSSEETVVSKGTVSGGLVNINIASKDELKTLNGIGDVTADKIIEYRKSNRFKKKEDIKSVKGIGDGIYEKIKDNITC